MKVGFDNQMYLKTQSEHIKERIASFGDKLYLEFGGKLFDDYHASRVLPGFEPDSKLRMLLQLKDQAEIIISISAIDIEKNKIREDHGITYDADVLRLIDAFRGKGLFVGSVCITQYSGQKSADTFKERLENLGIKVYRLYLIDGYPSNVSHIVSEEGYGKNDYIITSRPLVIVTAPGPGSGKMATCLSQLYHENKRGVKAGYAKFETFPIWNLPLKHPVNLAYEAATADLNDVNMIDPFHLEAIFGECPYKSPTDMGVNMAGNCIIDDEVCREASKQEIIRRYYNSLCRFAKGECKAGEVYKLELIMQQAKTSIDDRRVVSAALLKAETTQLPAAAMELENGELITGKTSELLGASAALILNVLKALSGVDDEIKLISPTVIAPVQELKTTYLGGSNPRLHIDEALIALSISAATDENARKALHAIPKLKGLQMHSSVMLSDIDMKTISKLGIGLTTEAKYGNKK